MYVLDPTTALLPIGDYHGIIEFSLLNYETRFASVGIEILPIPTQLNDTQIPEIPYELYCYSPFTIDFGFTSSYDNSPINSATVTYLITDIINYIEYSGTLMQVGEVGEGKYQFDPGTETLPIGTYTVEIKFEKANHTTSLTNFAFKINPIPLSIEFQGGSSSNYDDLLSSNEYFIDTNEIFYFNFSIVDVYDDPIQDYEISYILTKDDWSWNGTLQIDDNGNCFGNLSEITDLGLYSLTITIQKGNYTTLTIQRYINVEYPELFGISLPFLIIGGSAILIALTGVVGYVTIKKARVPKYIKDLNKLEKYLTKSDSVLPEKYLSRSPQLKNLYGRRWEEFDLEFSIRDQIDEISLFVMAYQEATGKLLLNKDAKQFLDDLVIYSKPEIRKRLQSENIGGENLSNLMDIILNYIQQTSNVSDDTIEIVDDFDIDFDQLARDEK
jgi:hypothetical protein